MNNVNNDNNFSAQFQPSTATRVLDALAAFDLKAERGTGKYRCNSPLRPGSNSHAFNLTIEDEEHGAFFDHVSEQSGTLYDLAKALGIDLPRRESRQSIVSTKRVYSGLDEYAQAHGVPAEVFRAAGWSEQITYQQRPALAFKTANGTRYRFLDGDKPTYKSETGYTRCWYGLSRAVQLAQETGQPLVICNGEASTVVGQHFGVAACAVTGGEKKELPAALLDALRAVYTGPVLVAFDCLDKGADVAPQLAGQLRTAGFAARAVDLGLSRGGDLADFCHLYGNVAAAGLSRLPEVRVGAEPAIPNAPAELRWRWIPADALDTLPPIRWLIEDEIPEQALVVLFGPSGAGKSFIALDYSLRVAQEHPVLYIAAEGHRGYASRKIAWCKHHGKGSGQLYFPDNNTVVGLLDPQTIQDFITSVTPLHPKLIVFDTLAWCMTGGDENSTGDMQRLITHCRQIQTATGATVLLIHHTGKSGASERGSSALRGGADMMIELTNDDEVITLSCSKSKETEGFEDRHLARLTIPTRPDETSCVWIPTEKVMHTKADKLTRQQREVLDTLAAPVFIEVGARFAQLFDALPNISRSGLYKTLNRLMDARLGYITQGQKGEPFKITDAGKTALARGSTAASGNNPVESTLSTGSLPESTASPSPLSTLSTPSPEGGHVRQETETPTMTIPVLTDMPVAAPSVNAPSQPAAPTLSATEYDALAAFGQHTRGDAGRFVNAAEVFSESVLLMRPLLQRLCQLDHLQQERSTTPYYRLTDSGWQRLGLKVTRIDLRNY